MKYGAEESRHCTKVLELLGEFAAFVPVLPTSEAAGEAYGAIRATPEPEGKPVATTTYGSPPTPKPGHHDLVTKNEHEFKRVPGLKV
jgi:tRNA(fMet)-specific endonuclease VapC